MPDDYFYEEQSEQFSFYRIPKALMTEKAFDGLSGDAKILYGLCLDRVSLSRKNRWVDAAGRIYIYYTLNSIMGDVGCAVQKAVLVRNKPYSKTASSFQCRCSRCVAE